MNTGALPRRTEMAVTMGSAAETHALAVAMVGGMGGVALTVGRDEHEAALRNLVNALVRKVCKRASGVKMYSWDCLNA